MPAKERINREQILDAALSLVRREGEEALSARGLSRELGCSTQPIFRCFASMEEVRAVTLERVHEIYLRHMADYCAASPLPAYKASGMAYISFAGAEPNCFRMLFMRSRPEGEEGPEKADWEPTIRGVAAATGLPYAEAERFHLTLWAVVHGLAVMRATGYLTLDDAAAGALLTDAYQGLRKKWEVPDERH